MGQAVGKEWTSEDRLPRPFVELVKGAIYEKTGEPQKAFVQIAQEWGVSPGYLSRWLAGVGPLTKQDISHLIEKFGDIICLTLGLPPPADED